MKHNLHKNAYLVSDNTIPALQKIFKTEWEPLGYKLNAKGTTDIERVKLSAVSSRENISML